MGEIEQCVIVENPERPYHVRTQHCAIATAGQNCGIICVSLKAEGGE